MSQNPLNLAVRFLVEDVISYDRLLWLHKR
jgi:hypothetical protein